MIPGCHFTSQIKIKKKEKKNEKKKIQETLCTFKTKIVALSIAQSGDLQTGQILISLVLTIPMWSASLWTSHNPGSRTGYIFICLKIKYLKTRKNVVKVPIAPND